MSAFLSDQYRKDRGGWSRMLKVSCQSCNSFLFYYQKDGPGPLKRSYLDRIDGKNLLVPQKDYVFCPHCKICLGFFGQYEKENGRPAIFWLVGAVDYKIVPKNTIKR